MDSSVSPNNERLSQSPAVGAVAGLLLGIAVLLGLYLTSFYSYLLFHTLVETFSIVVACGIFMIAWNARRFLDNNYLLFIGIASLFVAAIDLLHTMAYKNMGVFTGFDANLPTQLWIAARYLQSLSLLIAPLFLRRTLRPRLLIAAYAATFALLVAAIFAWRVFPDCYLEGVGLTPFKKGSEYLIALMLLASLGILLRMRRFFDRDVLRLLAAAITLLILAEMAFTLYFSVFGISNLVGHLFKVAAFYLTYKAIIETGLARPYDLLFRELKQSEASLEAANEELGEINAELEAVNDELATANVELETANAELETTNTGLEAFSYTVSHDLRSPLNNISGCAQVLLEIYKESLDPEGRKFIAHINAESVRMGQLITTLLNFSRLSKSELHCKTFDLSDLANNVAAELQLRDPARRLVFRIAKGITVTGDERLLQVVLENLLGNAWKYTARKEEAVIEFGVAETGGQPRYFVRDNGAGFDMSLSGKLFTPFARLHREDEFKGHGIGLATVQRIIQRHGGRVWAEGESGKGATFYFTL